MISRNATASATGILALALLTACSSTAPTQPAAAPTILVSDEIADPSPSASATPVAAPVEEASSNSVDPEVTARLWEIPANVTFGGDTEQLVNYVQGGYVMLQHYQTGVRVVTVENYEPAGWDGALYGRTFDGLLTWSERDADDMVMRDGSIIIAGTVGDNALTEGQPAIARIDPTTGQPAWITPLEASTAPSMSAAGQIEVGGVCLNARTGSVEECAPPLAEVDDSGSATLTHPVSGLIASWSADPEASIGAVYVSGANLVASTRPGDALESNFGSSAEGSVIAVGPNGTVVWRIPTSGIVVTASDRFVVVAVAATDSTVILDAGTGDVVAQWEVENLMQGYECLDEAALDGPIYFAACDARSVSIAYGGFAAVALAPQ